MGFPWSKKVKYTSSLYLYLIWLKSYSRIPFRWRPYWIFGCHLGWDQQPTATSVLNLVLVDGFVRNDLFRPPTIILSDYLAVSILGCCCFKTWRLLF